MEESKSVNLKFGLSHHEHNPRLPKLNSTNQVNNIGEYISTENWGRLANTSNDDTLADDSSDILCTQAAIKGYVDGQIGTVNSFLELTDTPVAYTTANSLYTTNGTPDGIIETTTLLSQPAENQFKITRGTTDLLMTSDLTVSATCDLNQNLSTSSSVDHSDLTLTKTTSPQLSLNYDGTNKTTFETNTSGNLICTPFGGITTINGSAKIINGSLEILNENPDNSLMPTGSNKGLRLMGSDVSPFKTFDIGFASDASASHGPDINFIRSGGSLGTPLASAAGYRIGNINWYSYGGADSYLGANIQISAIGITSATNHGMRYHVSTAANNEVALTLRYGVNDDGKFFVGSDTTTDALNITTDGSGNATLLPSGGNLKINGNMKIVDGHLEIVDNVDYDTSLLSSADKGLVMCGDDSAPYKSIDLIYSSASATDGPTFNFIRSRGNSGTPTASLANDILGLIEWRSYDGTSSQISAQIDCRARGDTSVSNRGCNIDFKTVKNGETALGLRGGFIGNGLFFVGSDSTTDALKISTDGAGVGLITPSGGELTIDGDITITDLNCADIVASGSLTPSGGTLSITGALSLNTGTSVNEFSIDGTLAGDSDDACPTEKAIKTYVDAQIGTVNSFLELADTPSSFTTANALYTTNTTPDGIIELTTLVSEPAENQFKITRGTTDLLMTADLTASATCDLNQNLSTTSAVAFTSVSLTNTVSEFSTDGTMAGDSDSAVPTEKAVKTYVDSEITGTTGNTTLSMTGPGSSNHDSIFYFSLTDRNCTIRWENYIQTDYTGTAHLSSTTAIPVAYRPAADVYLPMISYNDTTAMSGYLRITTTGLISIYPLNATNKYTANSYGYMAGTCTF